MEESKRKQLLSGILKHVSRSFYLTLWVVPVKVRDQLGLAYLFCRAADTIADTDLIPSTERLKLLFLFREQFQSVAVSGEAIAEIQNSRVHLQENPAERTLLARLTDCFHIFEHFSRQDQNRIRKLVATLTKGMEMDLTSFPTEGAVSFKALPSGNELDQYCYYVAGVVGEFWTRMIMGHFESLEGWEEARMCKLGVHFGKGLQMTNILKDLAKDLAKGRCYLPQNMLDEFKIDPESLKKAESVSSLKPLLAALIRLTLYHLEGGWQYILAIPRREVRLRLACLWPHLFAVRTLDRIYHANDLLNPRATVKISRREVYITMLLTTLLVFSNRLLTRYYERLRHELITRIVGE
jgi:farnesyl-diphosphate farnesyltransferase